MDAGYRLDTTPRRAITVVDRYEDAQAVVDKLADRGFPVEHLVIVGRDPQVVETVTGRLDAWRALAAGAGSGAVTGLIFGLLFGALFSPDGVSLLAIVAYWVVVATIAGALFGLISYAFSGKRSFTSESAIRASRYEVLADDAVADEARRVLGEDLERRSPGVRSGTGPAPRS